MRYCNSTISRFSLMLGLLATPWLCSAQQELLNERWLELETENFHIFSQLSSRQTRRVAANLETWRKAAAYTVDGLAEFPKAKVPNYVYLFDDIENLQLIAPTNDVAFFSSDPRANYMALLADDEYSMTVGLHHYVHFLVRNFSDMRLPRWYEEGLAGYISRMQVNGDKLEFERYSDQNHQQMALLSESLSMSRLLYSDAALASPRLIQIANLKSEALLHYFLHAYEEEGFNDRRTHLDQYLQLLLVDRNSRYAYDQAFDVTTEQLDEEFHNYLRNSSRPRGTVKVNLTSSDIRYENKDIEGNRLALALAELALNSGEYETAQSFFQVASEGDEALARGLSGVGDAIRMQDIEGLDQEIASQFIRAVELAPAEVNVLLDYGEYWEAELLDCDKIWPAGQRRMILADIDKHFSQALVLSPDSPEANLAMGQLYLLEGKDWHEGRTYQQKAFALQPADTYIMEQAVKYAIAADEYEEAERLIDELAQPIHSFGEPNWVANLRERLLKKRRSESFDECAQG